MTTILEHTEQRGWPEHVLRAGTHRMRLTANPKPDEHRESSRGSRRFFKRST